MKWLLLGMLLLFSRPVHAGPNYLDDISRGWRYAEYDTSITTSNGSVDTVYFGGFAREETFEVATSAVTVSWHLDWRSVPVYGTFANSAIVGGRRAGKSLVEKLKTWGVGAGATASYEAPVSGMVVRGTGTGTIHIHCWVRVR